MKACLSATAPFLLTVCRWSRRHCGLRLAAAVLLAGTVAPHAPAATFSGNLGGELGNSSSIGAGGDYPSLTAAASDFNAFTGGMRGPYTFLIAGDLTEPANVAWGNATNGHTLTIRPAPGVLATITFTGTAPNSGPAGHWVIGSDTISAFALQPITGLTIDGSDVPGGTNRNLTIQNATGAIDDSALLHVVGASTGVMLRNLHLRNQSTSTSTATYGVLATGRWPAGFPDALTLDHCRIEVSSAALGYAIGTTSGTSIPSGEALQNLNVANCDLTASASAVWLRRTGSFRLHRNTLAVQQVQPGSIIRAVHHASDNDAAGTAEITANIVRLLRVMHSVDGGGAIGFDLQGGLGTGAPATLTLHNNSIAAFDFPAMPAADHFCGGIRIGGRNITAEVHHQSICIGPQAGVTGATDGRVFGLQCQRDLDSEATIDVANNAIVVHASPATGIVLPAGSGGISSRGNNLWVAPGSTTGRRGAAVAATFGQWQAWGYDSGGTGGQSLDLLNTSPSQWNSHNDLTWVGSGRPLGVRSPASLTVSEDATGSPRILNETYPGAFDHPAAPLPVEVILLDLR